MPMESTELQRRLANTMAMVFDVDGVLTDGGLILGDGGEQHKRFHVRDGHGIKLLQNSGVVVAIITGRTSGVVAHRCAELGIEHVYQGCRDKWQVFQTLADKLSLTSEQFAYMGDDVIDLPVMSRVGLAMTVADAHPFVRLMSRVGLAMTVADAHPFVRQHAHWVSQYNGGYGAAREACEAVMQARGTLDAILQSYLD